MRPLLAPALVTRRTATAAVLGLLAAMLTALPAVVTPAPATAAVGAPVLIDDFGGLSRGRTITTSAVPEGTTSPATFSEAGGVGTTVLRGNGNGRGMLQLDYDFPALDLTAGVSNTQFFMEFDSITRTPVVAGQSALSVTINVRDVNNQSATYNTGIQSVNDFNIVLNFECETDQNACFKPVSVDFTQITHVQVQLIYPTNQDPTGATTAVLDRIRTTPTGGAQPPPPTTQITPPSGNPVVRTSGSTVDVAVDFRSNGAAVPVTSSPVTQEGLLASDVQVTSTVPGASTRSVSGGPSDYLVTLGPLTGSGPITIEVPAGAVVDGWAQDNTAGTATFNFLAGVPPTADDTRTLPAATVGTAYSQILAATGTPTPTWSVTSGTLPAGLNLSPGGIVSGTPTTAGAYSFTATAQNSLGTAAQAVSVQVRQAPAITSAAGTTFTVGTAGSFTVTTTGLPAPAVGHTGALPGGVTFVDNGNGTATLSGTPVAGASDNYKLDLIATNAVGSAQQVFTLDVHDKPSFTSPSSVTFDVGQPGSFTVATAGLPRAALTVAGPLPQGLEFTDKGNGTATITGVPTSNGSTSLVLTATNSVGSATQAFTLDVRDLPTFTSATSTSFTVGAAGSFTVTTSGFPTADLEVDDLPDGVTFVDKGDGTGTLAGIPEAPGGVSILTFEASNSIGTTEQDLTLTVNEPPAITSADRMAFVRDVPRSFTVTASGFPAPDIRHVGLLPDGLAFVDRADGTATISGTPSSGPGSVTIDLVAENGIAPDATQTLTIVTQTKPAFTSAAAAAFVAGASGAFTVTSTGDPVPEIALEGPIPPGLTLTDQGDGTATLAGTPIGAGVATLVLTATSGAGSAKQSLVVTVAAAPVPPDPDGPSGPRAATCLGSAATIVGGPRETVLTGTPGDDVIVGGPATTAIHGGDGDDVLCPSLESVEVSGGAGDDVLRGGPGDDRLAGGPGDDVIDGWAGNDAILGGSGADVLNGNWGDDRLWGQDGDDETSGRRGRDLLDTGVGDDLLVGGRGPDRLLGGPDVDDCQGGEGDDSAQGCEVQSGMPRTLPASLVGA